MHGADVGKDGLILSIWNVPAEVCTRIAQFDPDGSGPLGDGIAAVTTWEWMKFSVSQRVYDENPGNSGIVSIGVTPAYAAELCKDIEGSGWWNMHVYYYWD